ncbi:NHL repeat-containing protein [Bacteroidota bacterium]
MKFCILLNILVLFCINIYAQKFLYERSIGEFNNATSFYINPAGILFVTDDFTDEVYQLDTLGNLLNTIGGYGWDINAFDDPVDIYADPLTVFVTDKNNHRIQMFDKNLNFIFEFNSRESEIEEERFGYPVSTVQSNQGDVIILDSENKKILKFNLFGDFIQTIGGYDYGSYTLSDPKKLAVSMRNNIYVLDDQSIFIYDSYGTGIGNIETPEEIHSIRIIFNWLSINSEEKVYITNLSGKEKKLIEVSLNGYDDEIKIVSSMIFKYKLFLLTAKNILIFSSQ